MKPNWPLLLILAGILLRVGAVAFMDIQQDGSDYSVMGKAIAEHGNLVVPWGSGTINQTTPSESHQYGPIYPFYLAAWYHFAGYGVAITKAANLVLSLATIAVIYYTTKQRYGPQVAAWTTGLFSLIPRFIMSTGTGFSENLVALVVALTLWAILKGLTDNRYLALAGFFAGLTFLTRSGMGVMSLIGIGSGIIWRLKYQGAKKTITNHYYLLGGAIFAAIVGYWSWRNYTHFGSIETNNYLSTVMQMAAQYPTYLAMGILFKTAQFILIGYLFYAVFQPEWKTAWKNKGTEANSFLWLGIILAATIGALIAGTFWAVERYPPFWMDAERYLCIAYIPLLWLLFTHTDFHPKRFVPRFMVLASIFILVGVYEVAEPTQTPEAHAAEALAGHIHSGDLIGIQDGKVGISRYSFYPYLPTWNLTLVLCHGSGLDPCNGARPQIVLGVEDFNDPHYHLLRQDSVSSLGFGAGKIVKTYELDNGNATAATGCDVIGRPFWGNVTVTDYESMQDYLANRPESVTHTTTENYLCHAKVPE